MNQLADTPVEYHNLESNRFCPIVKIRTRQPSGGFDSHDECRVHVTAVKAMKFQNDSSISFVNFMDQDELMFDLS